METSFCRCGDCEASNVPVFGTVRYCAECFDAWLEQNETDEERREASRLHAADRAHDLAWDKSNGFA